MVRFWVGVAFFVVSNALVDGADPQADQTRPGWQHSFATAEKVARSQQLPMVVHFHAEWCGPCKAMERSVLSQPATLDLFGTRIVGVKVDSDRNPDVVKRFSVTSLPTDIFLDSSGSEVTRTIGTQDLSSYVGKLNSLVRTPGSYPQTQKVIERLSEGSSSPKAKPVAESGDYVVLRLRPAVETVPSPKRSDALDASEDLSNSLVSQDSKPIVSQETDENGYRLGFAGFSPVARLNDQKWTVGLAQYSQEYMGVCYRFASESELRTFTDNPGSFIPSMHGFDPVAFRDQNALKAGKLEFSIYHVQRLFFFVSKENRDAFQRNADRYGDLTELQLFRRDMTTASVN